MALFLFAPRFKSNELEQPEIKQNIYTKMILTPKLEKDEGEVKKNGFKKIAAKSKLHRLHLHKNSAPVAKHTPTKAVLKISKKFTEFGFKSAYW